MLKTATLWSLLFCPFLSAATIDTATITGTFVNPSPSCVVPISCTGEGSNLIFLGDGGNSNFMFYLPPAIQNNPQQGVDFDMGSLTLQNGETVLNTSPAGVTLHLQSVSNIPEFNVTLDLLITYVITPNVNGNDAADADFLYFPNYPQFGSFRVPEHQAGYVNLVGSFNSLHFEGFNGVGLGGFLSPSLTAVPEPSSYALIGGALLALTGLRRRATKKAGIAGSR